MKIFMYMVMRNIQGHPKAIDSVAQGWYHVLKKSRLNVRAIVLIREELSHTQNVNPRKMSYVTRMSYKGKRGDTI